MTHILAEGYLHCDVCNTPCVNDSCPCCQAARADTQVLPVVLPDPPAGAPAPAPSSLPEPDSGTRIYEQLEADVAAAEVEITVVHVGDTDAAVSGDTIS